jgi:ribose 5-phosphate isomerase A
MTAKQAAGEKATEWVQDGMKVGLGTGSTAYYMIKKLGEMVREGLNIVGIPTSVQTEELARAEGIPLQTFAQTQHLDLTIDGADEFTENLNLINGGGGALYREKLVASISDQLVIIADPSKLCTYLGAYPLPVEVVPFGWEITSRRIQALGATLERRKKNDAFFLTDNGNYILDCHFGSIQDPEALNDQLRRLIGVVETGLFVGMTTCVIMGNPDGSTRVWSGNHQG